MIPLAKTKEKDVDESTKSSDAEGDVMELSLLTVRNGRPKGVSL